MNNKNWEDIILDQASSGLTVRDFCKVHDLAVSTFYKQKRNLKKDESSNQGFSKVDMIHDDHQDKVSVIIDGHNLEFDPALLDKVIGALR